MSTQIYDCAVVGLGAMGSAALYQLSKRGLRVIGLDQFKPPHTLGSSHGETRITRQAIGEGDEYVPLALRSYEIWDELAAESGHELLQITGGLFISATGQKARMHGQEGFFEQTVAAAKRYGINHRLLSSEDVRREFPQFEINEGESAYYEDHAGVLRPELCVAAQLAAAKKRGASIHTDERVQGIDQAPHEVVLTTAKGRYVCKKLVLCAGPWIGQLLPELKASCRVYRQTLYWFAPRGPVEPFRPGRFPIFIWTFNQQGDEGIYGFPAMEADGGVKVATEVYMDPVDPDLVKRQVSQQDITAMYQRHIAPHLPGLSPQCLKTATCLYTVTPQWRFIIAPHPRHANTIVASPCSGHGFKHSAAIGEVLAELVVDGRTRFDISKFAIP